MTHGPNSEMRDREEALIASRCKASQPENLGESQIMVFRLSVFRPDCKFKIEEANGEYTVRMELPRGESLEMQGLTHLDELFLTKRVMQLEKQADTEYAHMKAVAKRMLDTGEIMPIIHGGSVKLIPAGQPKPLVCQTCTRTIDLKEATFCPNCGNAVKETSE